MSKNIVIQEDGLGKQLTVDKLKTNIVGGGTCMWVPEDATILGTKSINKNGTYRASDDGYYGYEQVTVNVSGGSGTATGTDGDGDEAVAYPDPETGELVIEKVPSSIKVITPPTNPYGIYTNGQSISTNGMVVKAYLETGGEYGVVPISEITINPTTAVYDSSTDRGVSGEADIDDSDYDGWNPPIPFTGIVGSSGELSANVQSVYSEAGPYGIIYSAIPGATTGAVAWFSLNPTIAHYKDVVIDYNQYPPRTLVDSEGDRQINALEYTEKSHTPFYWGLGSHGPLPSNPAPHIGTVAFDAVKIGTILFDGTRTEQRAGSHQTITVSWPRPLDGKVLETTFEILVAPPYSSEE